MTFTFTFLTSLHDPHEDSNQVFFVFFFLVKDAEPLRVELLSSIYRVKVTESMGVLAPARVFHSPAVNRGLCNGPVGEVIPLLL